MEAIKNDWSLLKCFKVSHLQVSLQHNGLFNTWTQVQSPLLETEAIDQPGGNPLGVGLEPAPVSVYVNKL